MLKSGQKTKIACVIAGLLAILLACNQTMQATTSRILLTTIPKRLRLPLSPLTPAYQYVTRSFTSTTMVASTPAFFDAVKSRRSIYALESDSPVSDARIEELVRDAMLYVPSSFNSQSTRVILLLKDQHKKYWQMTRSILAEGMDEETAKQKLARLNGFEAAYGSVCAILERNSLYNNRDAD